eukprot:scaffold34089_cov51-Isochrysis_galbana.AAC.1
MGSLPPAGTPDPSPAGLGMGSLPPAGTPGPVSAGAWKAHEGAMLGVTALIRAAPASAKILEGGSRLEELTPTLYRLLAHPQIT